MKRYVTTSIGREVAALDEAVGGGVVAVEVGDVGAARRVHIGIVAHGEVRSCRIDGDGVVAEVVRGAGGGLRGGSIEHQVVAGGGAAMPDGPVAGSVSALDHHHAGCGAEAVIYRLRSAIAGVRHHIEELRGFAEGPGDILITVGIFSSTTRSQTESGGCEARYFTGGRRACCVR